MSLVATGGYGRGLLAPGSDVDLLFLLPYKQTAWGESVVENILYMLWDLGFKVGHATRTVDQCVRLSQADMTIRTALLDARLLWGDESLFDEFQKRFHKSVVRGSGREFVEAKLAEQDDRHTRSGATRYLVEPNIKDGKGGLRDLHTLHWLAKYLTEFEQGADFVKSGVFSPSEYHEYRKCEDFLWTVRCHLHFLTGRAEERLSFDVQPTMAERLGYAEHRNLRAVERFMKHYFLLAKEVGDLTQVVCSALEMKELKQAPKLNRLFETISFRRRKASKISDDFRLERGRITIAGPDIFENDPVNLIRLFALAEEHNVPLHPDALRLVRASLRLVDRNLRRNKQANEIFLDMLTSPSNPENALRKMNEAGVLGRFIPDFGRVVSMMQFNMYHHYTVDEHLIRSIGILNEIENGDYSEEHPVSTEIFDTIEHRRALYVAMFIHDVAKGRGEDHSVAGARVARKLGPRLGLTAEETEIVAWLVEHHLLMSQVAQSRDINDPKTVRDFASIIETVERLKLLLILTVADIRAVGPGVWNGWKGQLLRTLYFETEPDLEGGRSKKRIDDYVGEAQQKLQTELPDWSEQDFADYVKRHYSAYWLKTDLERQVDNAELVGEAERTGAPLTTKVKTDDFTEVTEITIFTATHPRLLSMIAGACVASGADIVDAHIATTRDGMALDTISLRREFEREDDEHRRANRIVQTLEKLIRGDIHLSQLVDEHRKPSGRIRAFEVEPRVRIDNTLSDDFTVVEIRALDRPGLLYDLTRTLSDLNLDISSAHIATFGEKAIDTFYVTDLVGNKITYDVRRADIKNHLLNAMGIGDDSSNATGDVVSAHS